MQKMKIRKTFTMRASDIVYKEVLENGKDEGEFEFEGTKVWFWTDSFGINMNYERKGY